MESAPLLFGYVSQEAAAIVATVLAAFAVGWLTIRHQRHIARARLTFETLTAKIWDNDYLEKRKEFIKLCGCDDVGLARYADKQTDYSSDEMNTVRAVLNDYEVMAIGIRQGILDEAFLFRYERGTAIRDWNRCSAFVTALRVRNNNPLLYVEFEGLATQWQNNRSYRNRDRKMPKRHRRVSVS